MSTGSLRIFSGVFAATSSMSMPPAGLTMNTGFFDARSRMMPTYASVAMSAAGVTSTFCTVRPLICMPRIFVRDLLRLGRRLARASRRPPCRGRRRAPAPSRRPCRRTACAIASASSGVVATSPGGIGTPSPAQNVLGLILVNVHASPLVSRRDRSFLPRRAPPPGRDSSDVMIARPPVRRTKSTAARIFGAMLPSPNAPARPCASASVDRQRAERALLRRAPVGVHRVDVGQDQQQLGAEIARQHRGGEILVDHRVDPFPARASDRS